MHRYARKIEASLNVGWKGLPLSLVISQQQLVDWGACREGVLEFLKLFPGKAELTRRNVMKAAHAGVPVWWLATKILNDIERLRYYRETKVAWRTYKEIKDKGKSAKVHNVTLAEKLCDVLGLTA